MVRMELELPGQLYRKRIGAVAVMLTIADLRKSQRTSSAAVYSLIWAVRSIDEIVSGEVVRIIVVVRIAEQTTLSDST
jgi:hypothetical protein